MSLTTGNTRKMLGKWSCILARLEIQSSDEVIDTKSYVSIPSVMNRRSWRLLFWLITRDVKTYRERERKDVSPLVVWVFYNLTAWQLPAVHIGRKLAFLEQLLCSKNYPMSLIIFNSQHIFMMEDLLFFPFCWWRHWGLEGLSNSWSHRVSK